MTREEAMKFIQDSRKFGSRLGLERIEKLCELLGNPQDELKFVHIAGTNGKGSTSVFINNILIDAGYKTGLYTSPYIYDFNERIQINNQNITDEELTEIMSEISEKVDIMITEGDEYPTEFELITAAAFLYFKRKNCDIVVLEVGLGGIYDATNIIKSNELSVITSIDLDHTEYLGNTIAEVAKNKCGIIKENTNVLSYMHQKDEALSVIEITAQNMNSSFTVAEEKDLEIKDVSLSGNKFFYDGCDYETNLIGIYQIYNAITAINAAKILNKNGWVISTENIENGIRTAKWPARFEILRKSPVVIADGSHNSDGMRAFVETAKKILNGKKVIAILGMLKDKDYDYCMKELSSVCDTVVITEVDNPRRETAENLTLCAQKYFKTVHTQKENRLAVQCALSLAKEDDAIIAVGSLYMMENIKKSVV